MNNDVVNISDLFEDISITEEEKNELTGIYLASMYKTTLELLIAFNGNKKAFVADLNKFFQQSLSTLDEKQRSVFNIEIENQKKIILKKLVDIIKENANDELIAKIDENYDRLTAKLATEDILKK